MTGKRFTLNSVLNFDFGICDYGEPIGSLRNICELLNDLHEKKEILELQLKSATNEIDKLMDEINILTDTCHDCCKEIREENEELKHSIKCLEADKMELQQYIKRMQGDD